MVKTSYGNTALYLQYNLNGEHRRENDVSIGQDLQEKHKELLSNVSSLASIK